jgi:hypothetical protein
MAKYIKSVRIRRKFANGFDSKSELDIRVAIYDKAFSKRSVLGVEATVREETDARNGTNIIADPEKLNKIWPEVDYSGNRYKDLTDDEVLADYIRTQSKLSSVEYSIIQDPWIIEAPIFRNFGFDPYYLNNGTELYVKWFKFDDDIWEEVPGTYESGKTGSIPNVIDIKRNEPVSGGTVSANSGDRYLVGKNPTGPNWSKYGNSYNIVEWNSFGKFWQQTFLEDGMTVYVDLEEVQYKYSSGSPVIVTGGTEWSDKKGNEMEMTSSDYLIKLQGGTPSNLKSKIVKKVETINQKSNEMLMLSEDNKIVKYGLSASREIPSNIDDTDIVRRFIDDWKSMVPNYDLKLCSPSNQKCELIEYISPIQPLPGPSVDPTGASPSGVTGASGSYKQKLTIVFPEDFKVMAREDVPKFSIWIGEPQTEEAVDEFDFGPDSPFVIDEEYVEEPFVGEEESPSDIPEVSDQYVGKETEGSKQVNDTSKTTQIAPVNSETPGSKKGIGVKLPTGSSAYSHNSTQGFNLVDSQWYGDILTSAYAHIEHPTFDIPGTNKGELGCASWTSMVFYRAFGVHINGGKPVKKVPKSIDNFGSLGTAALGSWFPKNTDMWEKIPWKEGQPGDIINTERNFSTDKAGHVGVVMDTKNNDGSYNVASNSSKGFGSSKDPLGCGKLNYSIKKWQSVTDRNPQKTFCWRYKGPKLEPGKNE